MLLRKKKELLIQSITDSIAQLALLPLSLTEDFVSFNQSKTRGAATKMEE